MDNVRVLRILEYVGSRVAVENIVAKSITGTKVITNGEGLVIVRAATIGTYPEILDAAEVVNKLTKKKEAN